jgi:hypothetical protein
MEVEISMETPLNFHGATCRHTPEDSTVRNHRREDLKSYINIIVLGGGVLVW